MLVSIIAVIALFSMVLGVSQSSLAQNNSVNTPLPDIGMQSLQSSDLNWAGYMVVSDYLNPQPIFNGVAGSWIVPQIPENSFFGTTNEVTQWVGIGGSASGDPLIQAGTAEISYPYGGGNSYVAWYEMLPINQPGNSTGVVISNFVVNPGDVMDVYISEIGTGNSWIISILDHTSGSFYQNTFTYSPDKSSAEWIVEKNDTRPLSDFGTIDFGPAYTSGDYNQIEDQTNGSILNIGQLPNYQITLKNSGATVLAQPSAPDSDQNSFTVTWENSS